MAEPLADEDDDVEGRHGPPLSAFPAADKEFFDFVENGSVDDVRNFLDANRDFDIDVVNFQGLNALYVAVQEKNVGMVEFLLSRDIDVKDAGLHAVRVNEPRIVVMILDKLNAVTPAGEYVGVSGSSDFPDDTTPLVVAAQSGHYEMVKLLLDRKHRIAKPHPPSCNCEEICKPQRAAEDTLTLTKKRLNLYRAVANPAYICQTSEDPFLVAFALTKELDRAASYESEFYYQYKSLSQEIRKFTGELIGFARTASEVEAVLKRSNGVPGHSAKFFYPRLLLAMDCKQKEFVAHPNVQQVISSHWVGDWYEWKIRSSFGKVFTVLPRVLLLPVVVAAILLAPNSGRSKRWQTPINKFLSFIASYVVFLVFVFLQSNVDKTNQTRGPPSSGYEAFLVIYVASYAWSAFRLCVIYGLRRYLRTYWNW
ncbi:short transient receptor potential channel 4 [Orussus abietinus]|uniref:short transient receptor potential channel 4 n=1 Tax=Orussus abietinus TaxID=222816 RepID=UPI000C716353|nr:short transient receptor potential channel 4 [Orussus abietinus]